MSIKVDILWRVYLVFFAVSAIGLAILIQAYRVQTVRKDYWLEKADNTYLKYRTVDAQRGNIYSSDGRLLATTLPTFDIRFDLKAGGLKDSIFRNHVRGLSIKLGKRFPNRSARAWESRLTRAWKNEERYHLIKKKVDYRTMLAMKTWPIWNRGKNSGGLIVIENRTRKAPFGQLANRTVGYVKLGQNGEKLDGVGLEASFHEQLKGVVGRRLEQRVTGGVWVPVSDESFIEPENGLDIVTTIDVNVQDVTESSLRSVLKENSAEWGTAIVMEVKTGKIKSIANLKRNSSGRYSEDYNYAIGYGGEPGSTMKLATLAALIEDGYVSVRDSVDVNHGKLRLAGRVVHDSGGTKHLRNVTVKDAFRLSSNVAFTRLAHKYYNAQPKKFLGHLSDFHFDRKFGIEIEGENQPFYRNPKDDGWSKMSVSSIAFGYEIAMSPLHMLSFYNTVANDGKMMKPYMVESIQEKRKAKKEFKPVVLSEQLLSANTVQQLKECLVSVVEDGTAKNLFSKDYQSAGKTGTTKLHVPGAHYGQYYTASFAGFFPAEKPKYSCIVVVNKPRSGKYYGGLVAGPVFKAVADMLYARSLDIQEPINKDSVQDKSIKIAGSNKAVQTIQEKVFQQEKNEELNSDWLIVLNGSVKKMAVAQKRVPNVIGMGLDEALYLLENAGLGVRVVGQGVVKSQSLKQGVEITKGKTIQIKLGV